MINNEKQEKDRFIYQKKDIEIKKSQCDFCKYNNPDDKNTCIKFLNGKPEEIKMVKKRCEYIELN